MNKLILTILLAAGLAACTHPKRVGPPAPIISVGKTAPEFQWVEPKTATPPSRKERVEVYPYRLPASAPDAAGPRDVVPTEKSPEVNAGLRSERATSAPAKTSAPTPPAAPVSLPVPELLPAAGTLVKQAEQQRRAKNLVGAAATLERALGIQPRDPYIWNRLARVRIEQGLYSQAGNLASRSNALAGGRGALERDNWTIIATARKAAGDLVGSREAWRHARGG